MMLASNGSLQKAALDASDEHLQHLMADAKNRKRNVFIRYCLFFVELGSFFYDFSLIYHTIRIDLCVLSHIKT